MVQQVIGVGNSPGDRSGDPIRDAFIKVNENFTEIYSVTAAGANFDLTENTISAVNTNGNIELSPNGTGVIVLDWAKWPTADGTAGYILKTDGAGNLSWVTPSAPAAAGSDTQIQFNDAGTLTGSANLTYNKIYKTLSVDSINALAGTFLLANSVATTLWMGGAATTVNIGAPTGTTLIKNNLVANGAITLNGQNFYTTNTTLNFATANVTTLSIGNAATTLNIGSGSGVVYVQGNLQVQQNYIKMQGGADAIVFSGAGDVEAKGNLQVTGGNINMAAGQQVLSFSGTGNVATVGELKIGGNKIHNSAGTEVIAFSGTTANLAGNVNIVGNIQAANANIGYTTITGNANISLTANVGSLETPGTIAAQGNITSYGNVIVTNNLHLNSNQIKSSTGNVAITLSDKDVTVAGNLTISGTTTTIDSTVVSINDKTFVVANNQTTSAGIDGSGLEAGNPAVATFKYNHASTSWQSDVSVLPSANVTLNLGGASNYWANAYIANALISANANVGGNLNVTANANVTNNVNVTGNVIVLGNISGNRGSFAGNVSITSQKLTMANDTQSLIQSTDSTGLTVHSNIVYTVSSSNLDISSAGNINLTSNLAVGTYGTITLGTSGQVGINGSFGTAGQVIQSNGPTQAASWATNTGSVLNLYNILGGF